MADGDNSGTNLIVNYLPQTLTDDEFRNMFQSIGPIKSSKIVRDKHTNYSYGFGFVDYEQEEHARRAIQTLNRLQIQNKTIKVALARPGGETTKGANLYVRNLPRTFTEDDMNTYFSPYGKIVQSRVLVDTASGTGKGVGFVLFETKNQAMEAMIQLNGTTLPGASDALNIKFAEENAKKVRPPPVMPFPGGPGGPRYGPGPIRNQGGSRYSRYSPMAGYGGQNQGPLGPPVADTGYTLFVYNIGTDADEKTLWQLFSPFGAIQKVNVIYDQKAGQCKGYGFVTMTNYSEAEYAIQHLNGYNYTGRPLQVSFKSAKN
ncbi:ELAV-like protein 2 [Liolophura sinensis]|uniref:ELAV-like protein 2 n=1 Tax=Liolophura sinensis TaxID=3198878 RepID=UPI0031581516